MKKIKIYTLYTGRFGDDGYISNHFKYKKDAIAYIKELGGFKKVKDRSDSFYENEDECEWYRIDEDYLIVDYSNN